MTDHRARTAARRRTPRRGRRRRLPRRRHARRTPGADDIAHPGSELGQRRHHDLPHRRACTAGSVVDVPVRPDRSRPAHGHRRSHADRAAEPDRLLVRRARARVPAFHADTVGLATTTTMTPTPPPTRRAVPRISIAMMSVLVCSVGQRVPPTSDGPMIWARDLRKSFRRRAARPSRRSRASTSTYAAARRSASSGPNGAGKSSTMRMIAAVSPVTGGELRILGLDPAEHGPADPGPARRLPAGGHPRQRAQRLRQPLHLRPLLRHPAARGARARPRSCWSSSSSPRRRSPRSRTSPAA